MYYVLYIPPIWLVWSAAELLSPECALLHHPGLLCHPGSSTPLLSTALIHKTDCLLADPSVKAYSLPRVLRAPAPGARYGPGSRSVRTLRPSPLRLKYGNRYALRTHWHNSITVTVTLPLGRLVRLVRLLLPCSELQTAVPTPHLSPFVDKLRLRLPASSRFFAAPSAKRGEKLSLSVRHTQGCYQSFPRLHGPLDARRNGRCMLARLSAASLRLLVLRYSRLLLPFFTLYLQRPGLSVSLSSGPRCPVCHRLRPARHGPLAPRPPVAHDARRPGVRRRPPNQHAARNLPVPARLAAVHLPRRPLHDRRPSVRPGVAAHALVRGRERPFG